MKFTYTLQISDDEDETHPNIDTPSLYRWRHQARVERMEEQKKEIEEHDKKKSDNAKKLNEIQSKINETQGLGGDLSELKKILHDLEKEANLIAKKDEELQKKEKKTPWNIDTISKPGFAKTVINKRSDRGKDENLTEEQREARMKKFIKDHEKEMKHFGMLKKYDDSKQYLKAHNELVSEDTANYLVIWCINLEMEEVSLLTI